VQQAGLGFGLVELLSTCPTNWGMTPVDAMGWVETAMIPFFPLGDYKIADSVRQLG
jgi:2-oxoglutarate ferredoxin oxidoreductase subunit beta